MAKAAAEGSRVAPLDVRFIGDLVGRYVLSSREAASGDTVRVFGCRSRSISTERTVLQAPVAGAVGEQLALHFDDIGMLRASVSRRTSDGFVADFTVSEDEKQILASRIDWMKRRHLHDIPDRRESKRWLPRNPNSSLILAGSAELGCLILNVSATGAAISADVLPGIGHPIAVGALLGKVVRHIDCGFAVQFLTAQDPTTVESLLSPLPHERTRLLAMAIEAAEAAVTLPGPAPGTGAAPLSAPL